MELFLKRLEKASEELNIVLGYKINIDEVIKGIEKFKLEYRNLLISNFYNDHKHNLRVYELDMLLVMYLLVYDTVVLSLKDKKLNYGRMIIGNLKSCAHIY